MNKGLIKKIIILRKQGYTYKEITDNLKIKVPKSTLSYWCKNIDLPKEYYIKIKKQKELNLVKARSLALIANKNKRGKYLQNIATKNQHLTKLLYDKGIAKIALVMLYLGEGSKTQRGSLIFGNSNPDIIRLFLKLLRLCYLIDEQKFRCTLQCRADHDITLLEKYWSQTTKIPLKQFYKAQIDKRTIGKPSKKPDYKGVCRIDYLSADIYNEIKVIIELINQKFN